MLGICDVLERLSSRVMHLSMRVLYDKAEQRSYLVEALDERH